MSLKTSVSVNLMHTLKEYAASTGVDVDKAYQTSGFPSALLDDPETRVPAEKFHAFWLEIANQSSDPFWGLHFAEFTRHQMGESVLTAVMVNCSTLGEAMEKLRRYHGLSTDVIQVQFRREADRAIYAWEFVPANGPFDRQIGEAVICKLFFTLDNLSRGKISPLAINFRHPRPRNISEHQRIFGCPLVFDQPFDEIILQAASLDLPIPMANPKLVAPLEAIAQNLLDQMYPADTWADQVSHRISVLLFEGKNPAIGLIAQDMAVSTRQLQKKLKAEGVTYQRLLDQIREKMALIYFLEANMNLIDIAFLLGFSDQSAFNHAFKRWTGMTPNEYRKRQSL